jgi:hypothetical protein
VGVEVDQAFLICCLASSTEPLKFSSAFIGSNCWATVAETRCFDLWRKPRPLIKANQSPIVLQSEIILGNESGPDFDVASGIGTWVKVAAPEIACSGGRAFPKLGPGPIGVVGVCSSFRIKTEGAFCFKNLMKADILASTSPVCPDKLMILEIMKKNLRSGGIMGAKYAQGLYDFFLVSP